MKILIEWFINKYNDYKRKKRIKKKMEELRKKDPFIYRH